MKTLDTIIAELIQLDPKLGENKKQLRQLVAKLQETNPDTPIDAAFAQRLKGQLLATLETSHATSSSPSFMINPFTYMSYGALGAAVVALPALAFVFTQTGSLPMTEMSTADNRIAGVQIANLDTAAFGSLSREAGVGGGGGGGGKAAMAPQTMISADQEAAERSGKMIASDDEYVPTIQRHRYDGALPALPSEVRVLRREVQGANMDSTDILARLGLGLLNERAFSDTVLTNFSFKEDKKFGYSLYIDPANGTISINKNWEQWPNPRTECVDDIACHDRTKLQASDVPADEAIIAIADAFVATMDIDMTPYGQPVVQEQWRTNYLRAEDKSSVWIPEDIQVVYPLMIEGKASMEVWGNTHGLTVNVDIRSKKASGINQLTAQRYSASQYAGVDAKRFAQALRDGSTYPTWQPEGKYNEVVITLGAPKEVLLQHHQWDEKTNTSSQLLIPALHFPVVDVPAAAGEWYSRKGVVLPLAGEVYQERDDVRIMPLIEPAIEPKIESLPIEIEEEISE